MHHIFGAADDVFGKLAGLGIMQVDPVVETLSTVGTDLTVFDHLHQHQRWIETRIVLNVVFS